MSLGQAALLLGRLDQARSLAERAIRYISFRRGTVAHALDLLGEVATHPDCFDAVRGEVHYREALALAEPRAMRPLVAHCHLGIGKLYRRTGRLEQAREYLTIAATMYRQLPRRNTPEETGKELHARPRAALRATQRRGVTIGGRRLRSHAGLISLSG